MLVPVAPGVFTAVGMLASDVTHHFVRAAGGALEDTATLGRARTALDELSAEALATLAGEGYPRERVEIEALADLRYAGQASELVVPIPGGRLEEARLGDLRDAFDREYAATYGYSSDEPLELVNVRVVATGRREHRLDFRNVRIVGAPRTRHAAPGRALGTECAARRHAGGRAHRHRARAHAGAADRRGIRLHGGRPAGRDRVPRCLRQPGPHPGASAVTLDPITFAVIKSALDAIVDEMAYAVIRTARSEIIRDVMDYSAALCDAEGRMVAQAKTIAQHLGAVPDAMQSVMREFAGDLHPGDVVAMNDPYEGGMHIPDVFLFLPIFVDGALEAFAVVIGHQTDMGGRVPGSNASDSTEIYQEGLRIPPVKLYERGVLSRTMRRIIEKNVRVPERVLGDLGAQYAACKVGERELGKLFARYGRQTMHAHVAELLDYAERVTRAEIARWPRGTYRFTDHLDSDGLSDDPVPLTVAITVHDDGHLTCDWTGSAPQVRAALNSTLSFTKSCTYLSVRSVLRQDVPNNAGVFRCIDVIAPEGTILNPRLPGACAARALTGYRMLDVVLGALAQALPDRVPAAGEGGNTVLSMGGQTRDHRPFVLVDMITGAWGGRPDRDGMEAVTNPSQNMSNSPVEVLEANHPIRVDEYGFVPDSCGPGRFRGGLGLRRRYTLLNDEATLQLRSDRMRFQPYGLAGGGPARGTRNVLNPDGAAREMPAKFAVTLRRGDVVLHEQPGGGGHGDPFTRDPERVAEDVRDEKISLEFARREHGVVLDPVTLAVDAAATRAARAGRA